MAASGPSRSRSSSLARNRPWWAGELAARSLRYAHEVVGARGVTSHILAGNAGAVRVAERLGAKHAYDADQRVKDAVVRVYVYPDPA